ncbi:hypothetical protein [Micromonospora sp. 4G55]|uniref:hypothetical protein n=1 Tax=Micromonospora sp. 4G55 TaxID=2806102 RepID=UPI001A63CDA1|nr:hypothetical protein [Micromonospora sp. 4G55]MBM0256068.1 hypothetical protein [Micromonospora sp. 4G55]
MLTFASFERLAGTLSGHTFVKLVVDGPADEIHLINHARYQVHGCYNAEHILGITRQHLESEVDEYSHSFYADPDRRLYLGLLSRRRRPESGEFFCPEAVEVDTMSTDMLPCLYRIVRAQVDAVLLLLIKPVTYRQEQQVAEVSEMELPRTAAHELFSAASYVIPQPGTADGWLRAFREEAAYRRADPPSGWYDIVAMERVPDDVPRLAGIVKAPHTTPLPHTDVPAAGWGVPNAIQIDALDRIDREGPEGAWVRHEVDPAASGIALTRIAQSADADRPPIWTAHRVTVAEPESRAGPIADHANLRADDAYRYGTKAANLGELLYALAHGSERLLGWYRIPRAMSPSLLSYLHRLLGVADDATDADLADAVEALLCQVSVPPRGIALSIALEREFLESSAEVEQGISRLKTALGLGASDLDAHCDRLQSQVRRMAVPGALRRRIDDTFVNHPRQHRRLCRAQLVQRRGPRRLSRSRHLRMVTQVTNNDDVTDSVRTVGASLLSARSVRLRHQAGIALDDAYIGVVVQERAAAAMRSVLDTTQPFASADFRNVSASSAEDRRRGPDAASIQHRRGRRPDNVLRRR